MVNAPVTDPQFWENRYQQGTARWDLGQPAPPLVRLLRGPDAPRPGRVLVLGCGRGYDAVLFAQQGFEVVAVDFAPSAVAATQALAQAAQVSLQTLEHDIFSLLPDWAEAFDYVVEHTCFCAIDPGQRPAYAQLVQGLLRPDGELLALFFTHARPGGPPFGSTPAQIRQIFTPRFEIAVLEPVADSVPGRQGEEHWSRLRRR